MNESCILSNNPTNPNNFNNPHHIKYIGHTINISHGFLTVVDYATTLEANFIQIFLSSPQKYNNTRKSHNELIQFKQKLINNNMKLVIHGSYKLNFCNPKETFIHKAAIIDLVNDLNDSVKLGAIGVIIHMGKNVKALNLSYNEAFNNYIDGIKISLSKSNNTSTIILETGAGVGTEICSDIFNLAKLYNSFTDNEKARIKFCIDTCHIFAYGYHIGNYSFVDVFCDLIDKYLNWNNIACIHLNDSKDKLGAKLDNHADIGKGNIGTEGLKKFIKICASKNIPIVLETPCNILSKKDQIILVKNWVYEL